MAAPSNKLVTVNEALAKLKFLAGNREASERGGYTNTFVGFANRIMEERVKRGLERNKIENYRNTLESAAKKNKIDADNEAIISEICRFDSKGAAWRIWTKKDFENEYTGVQIQVQRLLCSSAFHEISVQAFFHQDGRPAQWPFHIEVVCQPARIRITGLDLGMAINRATLAMHWDVRAFPMPHVSRAADREKKLEASAEALAKKRVEVTVIGHDGAPAWVLSHRDGKPLGIISLDNCSDLHSVEDGLEVFFTLTIYDKDLNVGITSSAIGAVDLSDAEPVGGGSDEPPSIIRPDG